MKKILLVLVAAILLLSFQSKAQLGFKIGYNFAKMSGDIQPGFSEKSLSSLQFGVFLDKNLIPILGLRAGLDYSPKGYRIENGNSFEQMRLNYLEIPVLAKVKLGPIYALGGFYGAYALNGRFDDGTNQSRCGF